MYVSQEVSLLWPLLTPMKSGDVPETAVEVEKKRSREHGTAKVWDPSCCVADGHVMVGVATVVCATAEGAHARRSKAAKSMVGIGLGRCVLGTIAAARKELAQGTS